MKIKQRLSYWLSKQGITRKQIEQKKIKDHVYRVVKGTLREEADKDDAWIFHLGAHARIIFDVGSNIGQSSMLFLYHAQVERIFLIDPNPTALAVAAENLFMNNLMGMKASFIPAFLSDRVGDSVDFYTIGAGAAGSKYKHHAQSAAQVGAHFKVPTLTIDFLTDYYKVLPDLVKIDVEGAELEVLPGATMLASKQVTIFFVEIHSTNGIVANTESIIQWCHANHYDAYYLKDHKTLHPELIKERGRYHALLIPKDTPYPQYLKTIQQGDAI